MKNCELTTFATSDELAATVAGEWLRQVRVAVGSPVYCVALSGGRIASKLYPAITDQGRRDGVSFSSVHFFWADERCVPPDDAESNFRIAHELLFAPLGIEAGRIHRIRGEAPADLAAAEAEAELRQIVPRDAEGRPVLDLILLGMGEDGHVASLFPGESATTVGNPRIYRPVVAVKPPPRRITLGYRALVAAWEVWVLVSGPGKETALGQSLSPGGQTPLARLLRARAQTRVFADVRARPIATGTPPQTAEEVRQGSSSTAPST